jgi:hypothetical protein
MSDETEAPIIFKGPDARPGDAEAATTVVRYLRAVLVAGAAPGSPLAGLAGGANGDGRAVLDGLISLWVDLSLRGVGVARTDDGLRALRRDLPRMAAALRAAARRRPGAPGEPAAGHA